MRTTISLDDRLGQRVRERARQEGMSVSAFIALVLDDALKKRRQKPTPPFRLLTVGGEGVHAGIDLDRPRELLVAEDISVYSARRDKR